MTDFDGVCFGGDLSGELFLRHGIGFSDFCMIALRLQGVEVIGRAFSAICIVKGVGG